MKVLDSLAMLRSFPNYLEHQALWTILDATVELRTLTGTVKQLATVRQRNRPVDTAEIAAIRQRWERSGHNIAILNRREIRLLTRDENTVVLPAFLNAVESSIRNGELRLRPEPFIAVYFNCWKSLPDGSSMERLIRLLLANPAVRVPCGEVYRSELNQLFSRSADKFLAKEVLRSEANPLEVLASRHISPNSELAGEVVATCVESWVADAKNYHRSWNESAALQKLRFLLMALLRAPMLSVAAFQSGISAAVLNSWPDRSDKFRADLLAFIVKDKRLGDPRRHQTSPNWAAIPSVGQKVRNWLAQQDIIFFFDFVLPDRHDKHHRKEFWLQYVDQVQESQVALCPEDEARLRSLVKEKLSYSHIKENKISAFLMRFSGHPDIVAVEFSQVGNAVYFYDARTFKDTVGGFERYSFRVADLKDLSHLERFPHYPPGMWQRKVKTFLATKGVRP